MDWIEGLCGRLGEARLRSHGLTVGKAFSGAIVSVVGSDRSQKGRVAVPWAILVKALDSSN